MPKRPQEIVSIANSFAYVALFGWPAVCLLLFAILPLETAAVWSLLGGYMLLPSDFQVDVPLLPPLDKMTITAIATLLLCWMKGAPARPVRQSWLIYLFGLGYVVAPIFTSLGNSYELHTAAGSIPGFYPLDGLKIAGRNLITLATFQVGSRFLWTDKARATLLKALPTAMVFYSIPMLFEIRMSPQLHRWIYGYFPNDAFSQQIRNGGYRPVVFFDHGLELAFFTSLAVIAALVGVRTKWRIRGVPAGAVASYLSGLLVLCKSFGPVIYAAVLAPLVLLTRPRTWVKISCAIVLLVCAYPALRDHGLAPTQLVSKAAAAISPARSTSFQTRVDNEGQLLAKADEKPMFGWGTWGRNRIYDQWTGKDISITDGGWIIEFGTFGWFGYVSLFGLIAAAIFRALGSIGSQNTVADLTLGGLTLLLAIYVLDQIPNASQLSLTFLLAGSVASSAKVLSGRRVRRQSPQTASTAHALAPQ